MTTINVKKMFLSAVGVVVMMGISANSHVAQATAQPDEQEEVFNNCCGPMPRFPGGDVALMRFLGENIDYPDKARADSIQGRVVVQFVVSKTGEIGEVKVLSSVDPLLDNEAVRAVKTLPPFIPATKNGEPFDSWYILPITFKLQKEQ